MSTISAGTTSGTALVSTGDTSGQLVLQTNGTTTAVTIGTNQVVTLSQPLPVGSGGTGATSLSGITVGTATNATTATNIAGGAQGSVPYQSAAGTTALLAAGTSGQVLTTQGAGANPTWTTPSGGAIELISTATASSSSTIDFTNLDFTTYKQYLVYFVSISPSTTASFCMQTSSNNGSSWDSGSSDYFSRGVFGTTSVAVVTDTAAQLRITQSLNGILGFSGDMIIPRRVQASDPGYPAEQNFYYRGTSSQPTGGYFTLNGMGTRNSTTQVNAIRFLMTGGTILSGVISLYGVK